MSAFTMGCAVYDSGLVSSNGGLTGGGTATTGGSKSDAGSTASTSGKGGDGGLSGAEGKGGGTGEAGTGNGGTVTEPQGGAPSEGGEDAGGAAGTAASGNAGQAGSAGASAGTSGSGGSGGNGGAGGTAPVAKCSDHALTPKAMWMATASSESIGNGMESDGLYNPAIHMTDGSYAERWSSGKAQLGDEWIQIDFGAVVNVTGFTLNVNNDAGDYPRAYELRVSNTVNDFEATVRVSGEGMPGNTVMNFPMATGRYVTVRQTATNIETISWWTVAEVFAVCLAP